MHKTPQISSPTAPVNPWNSKADLWAVQYTNMADIPSNAAQNNRNVPCAVCLSPKRTMMYPARTDCPSMWAVEYSGYLMAMEDGQRKQDFVCVDGALEVLDESLDPLTTPAARGMMQYQEFECSPLQCPPYVSNRQATCAVCSRSDEDGAVFTRFGALSCPTSASELYQGMTVATRQDLTGKETNDRCVFQSCRVVTGGVPFWDFCSI